jgi:hypothetical protein
MTRVIFPRSPVGSTVDLWLKFSQKVWIKSHQQPPPGAPHAEDMRRKAMVDFFLGKKMGVVTQIGFIIWLVVWKL